MAERTTIEDWTPERVAEALERGEVVVVDVRTPQEFAFEHIEGALLSPMASFRADRLPTQDGKRIVFHCGSGMRSGKVARACAEAGYAPIAHMAGGFGAWKQAGLPYLAIDTATGGQKRVEGKR